MTTRDSTLVRLPNDLLARLDQARGDRPRQAFIAELLDRRDAPARPLDRPRSRAPRASREVQPIMRDPKGGRL